ncbi:MAG: hypothetical protein C0524_10565 [Rhodobacter sp.]|nr:hypothetical protein [Rhodobacter sp.]
MPGEEQVIKTQEAFVALAADLAFWLKIPVSFGRFDLPTLAVRAITCSEDVQLNRALAGDICIGAAPLAGCPGIPVGGTAGSNVDGRQCHCPA